MKFSRLFAGLRQINESKTNKRIPAILSQGHLALVRQPMANHLCRLPEGEKMAVLVNEYGSLDVALAETESNAGEPTGVETVR